VIYIYPKKFIKEYSGVIYRLGDSSYSEKIKISFDGYLSKRLFKGDKYQGTINIGDKKLPMIKMEFSIKDSPFTKDSADVMYYDADLGEYKTYGNMISSDIEDMFTIRILEPVISGGSTWSSANGLMVSAPANSRIEALDISNRLMKDVLSNFN
jgi:hypothetical protein